MQIAAAAAGGAAAPTTASGRASLGRGVGVGALGKLDPDGLRLESREDSSWGRGGGEEGSRQASAEQR